MSTLRATGAGAHVVPKAAALAMIDRLAANFEGSCVRVNSVLSGIIDTDANRSTTPSDDYAVWTKLAVIA
jgi:NAD(P)-dependent dehydrogenase (short-subunit alcohol dehydrogenase family)